MRKNFIGAALLATLGNGTIDFPQLCLKSISDVSSSQDDDADLHGDMNLVAKLPANDAAFVRPSAVKVCSDSEYVYGIQFMLKVHPPEFEKLDKADDPTGNFMGGSIFSDLESAIAEEEDIGREFNGMMVGSDTKVKC